MKQVATGVWRLSEFPPRATINIYLAGDVLIDAGRSWDEGRIRKQTADRELSMLALTHVHPDQQGDPSHLGGSAVQGRAPLQAGR